jgi:membrane protein YqaA with SNARE-associated domain
MGRHYAGILGSLAFVAILLRSLLHGGGAETSIEQALWWMAGFAAIGFVVGQLAEWIVGDSVRSRLQIELAAEQNTKSTRTT